MFFNFAYSGRCRRFDRNGWTFLLGRGEHHWPKGARSSFFVRNETAPPTKKGAGFQV